jgi:hypothetical protein
VQTTFELLHAAQDLIRDPRNWIQGRASVDEHGHPCPITSKRARCFCSIGALLRAEESREGYNEAARILDTLANGNLMAFNDTHTHAEVMALWDRAKDIACAAAA